MEDGEGLHSFYPHIADTQYKLFPIIQSVTYTWTCHRESNSLFSFL